jgi:hypothetical protein
MTFALATFGGWATLKLASNVGFFGGITSSLLSVIGLPVFVGSVGDCFVGLVA